MTIFNGIYRWSGTKVNGQEPIAWSPGAYDVRIYRRGSSSHKVELLKPFVCVYAKTGKGHSISAKPENFAKQLCREFSLEIERVLWVEELLIGDNRFEIVSFSSPRKVGETYFYNTEKREATQKETNQLEEELESITVEKTAAIN